MNLCARRQRASEGAQVLRKTQRRPLRRNTLPVIISISLSGGGRSGAGRTWACLNWEWES